MLNWILSLFTRRKFYTQRALPFIMSKTAKEIATSRTLNIIEDVEKGFLKTKEMFFEMKELKHQEELCHYHKDEFGVVKKMAKPLATHSTISKYKKEKSFYTLGLFIFLIVETALFYMISQSISGGLAAIFADFGRHGESIAMFVFSLLFASISAFILDTGLDKLYSFFTAKEHYSNKRIAKSDYQSALADLVKGIALILLVIAILITINKARSFAIDGGGANHNPYLITGLMVLSVAAGLWMGIAKRIVKKAAVMISLHEKWTKITTRMSKINAEMAVQYEKLLNIKATELLIGQQLLLDTQGLIGKEYDDRDEDLMIEYKSKMKTGKFMLNQLSVWEYQNLAANEHQLYNYMVLNNERVDYIFKELAAMMAGVDRMENERRTIEYKASTTSDNLYNNQDLEDLELDKTIKELVNPITTNSN